MRRSSSAFADPLAVGADVGEAVARADAADPGRVVAHPDEAARRLDDDGGRGSRRLRRGRPWRARRAGSRRACRAAHRRAMAGGADVGGSRTGAGLVGARGSSIGGGTPCGFCGVGGSGVGGSGSGRIGIVSGHGVSGSAAREQPSCLARVHHDGGAQAARSLAGACLARRRGFVTTGLRSADCHAFILSPHASDRAAFASVASPPRARPSRHLRPEAPARRPGGDDRPRDGGRADPGGDADRRRQVALLPAAGPAAAGNDARRLAADRADEGPVRQAARARRRRGPAEQRRRRGRDRRRRGGDRRGRRRTIVFTTPERLADPAFLDLARGAPGRACSSSTRRTASRSGATTSGRRSSRSAARSRASASRPCSP